MKLSNCLLPVPYFGKVLNSILDITLTTEVSPLLTQFVDNLYKDSKCRLLLVAMNAVRVYHFKKCVWTREKVNPKIYPCKNFLTLYILLNEDTNLFKHIYLGEAQGRTDRIVCDELNLFPLQAGKIKYYKK